MTSESAAGVDPVAKAVRVQFVLDMTSPVNGIMPDTASAANR
jgi:hypothetical protein